MGFSVGLDIAIQAIRAQQLAVDVTAHNIANANTDGYSRQEVLLRPLGAPRAGRAGRNALLGQVGRGVDASTVRRVRDQFVDVQIRNMLQSSSENRSKADALARLETVLNEPSDTGLGSLLADFWNSWRDLSNSPESSAARSNTVQRTNTLANGFQNVSRAITGQTRDVDDQIRQIVADLNTDATKFADLNQQIRQLVASGNEANDLRDQRDVLLDSMVSKAGVTYAEQTNGAVFVYLDGHQLVNENGTVTLAAVVGGNGFVTPTFVDDGMVPSFSGGQLSGLIELRDSILPAKLQALDTLASSLITEVNAVHQAGFGLNNATGLDFFSGTTADTIALDATIAANNQNIAAASAVDAPGDGSNALAIADLQTALLMSGGTATMDDYYRSLISQLGVDSAEARSLAENEESLVEHMDNLRLSVAGVNLDEEMANLIRFQHAYEAAGRLITVLDEMIDKLVNGTGLVGR